MWFKKAFDTSEELLMQRHGGGIRLVKPNSRAEEISRQSISNIYNSSFSAYFYDSETQFVDVNSVCAELAQGEPGDLIRKPAGYFTIKEFADTVIKDNKTVIQSGTMQVIEEHGAMSDNSPIHMMGFKFPWYYENHVIGVFGCSIKIDSHELGKFSHAISQLISTGLLSQTEISSRNILPNPQYQNIYFTRLLIDPSDNTSFK